MFYDLMEVFVKAIDGEIRPRLDRDTLALVRQVVWIAWLASNISFFEYF
jgi:hypothetical protein